MAYTEAELQKMLADAREAFMKIPGVVGVGFGYRETAGQIMPTICWRVYVKEKKEKSGIPPGELIPDSFGDFPTDVIKVRQAHRQTACEDSNSYSPLVCGATISNMIPGTDNKLSTGTLGFFATIDGNTDAKENVVFVSNHHVVAKNGASAGTTVFQPHREDTAGISQIVTYQQSTSTNAPPVPHHESLGTINNLGAERNHPYAYPSEASLNYWVDASTVKVAFSISSWCDTHCGIKFKPEVHNLGLNGGNSIAGYERVSMSSLLAGQYNVVKWGHRTSRTEGKVIDCLGSAIIDGNTVENAMCIVATSNNCEGNLVFSKEGDSGSAIINSNRMLIGLLFGGAMDTIDGTLTDITYACHIHPVLNYLAVTPITTAAPHAYMSTKADGPGSITGDKLFALKGRLATTTIGAQILGLFDTHRAELVELVNHCRPVTVAWRRHQGPGFTNRIMANSRNPEVLIPAEIEGVSLRQLCDAMLPQLLEHGSPALRADLEAWARQILPHTEGLQSLHSLVDQLIQESQNG